MARHNNVFLYGILEKKPRILKNDNGDFIRASLALTVIRGKRDAENQEFKDFQFDCPLIVSRNQEIIYQLSQLNENDAIFVKGNLNVQMINRRTKCPICDNEIIRKQNQIYVTPIFVEKMASYESFNDGLNALKERCEISNECIVAGNVCNDPDYYANDSGKKETKYQIAINRKYHIKEDPPELRTDYPWVHSFNSNAVADNQFIKKGTSVLIDGYIETRGFEQIFECPQCHKNFKMKNATAEIVPYSTEYLMNYKTVNETTKESVREKSIFYTPEELVKTEELNSDTSKDS